MNFTLTLTATPELLNAINGLVGLFAGLLKPPVTQAEEVPQNVIVDPTPEQEPEKTDTANPPVQEKTAPKTNKPTADAPKESDEPAGTKQPTIDIVTLRAAFAEKLKAGGDKKSKAADILKHFGVEKLSDLPAINYDEAYEMIKAV